MAVNLDKPPRHRPPWQIRVHGVGGPQATRMLGMLHDEDTFTVPLGPAMPTRFVRRLPDDGVEAYEWGALTTGTWGKGLWVLYLPLTLINAAGWAHPAGGPGRAASRGSMLYRLSAHAVAVLATVTYVLWTAYLLLDLVATRWVGHVTKVDPTTGRAEVRGVALDAASVWVPILAPGLFVVLVATVFGAPVLRRSRPTIPPAEVAPAAPPKVRRGRAETLDHPGFFAQGEGLLRAAHTAVVAVVAVAALVLHVAGWDRLGLLVVVTAAAQVVALVLMGVADLWGRTRWRWYEVVGQAALPPGLWEPRRPLPVGVALAAVGTALTHAAFAGTGWLLRAFLANYPEDSPIGEIEAHAELGAADVLGGVLALAVVGLLLTLGHVADSGEDRHHPIVALARRAHLLGTWLLVAVTVPVAAYGWLNRRAIWPDPSWSTLERWYDDYPVDRHSSLTAIGSLALSALPLVVVTVLRKQHRTGVGRLIGNVWDVLTFWPRRFHPFAVPAASERAVPELRARIADAARAHTEADPLVVAAHSQGSVLAVAALAGMEEVGNVRLVTFGSPLGTLYAPTWPGYIPRTLEIVGDKLGGPTAAGPTWVSFSRATDPVGAGVPFATNVVLPDPLPGPTPEELEEVEQPVVAAQPLVAPRVVERPPLERPRHGVVAGHSAYLADHEVRRAIQRGLPPPLAPIGLPPRPARIVDGPGPWRWAHRGGAGEAPENTIGAMYRALGPGRANALELDVQLSRIDEDGRGGVLVVSHDALLGRASAGRGRVRRHTADALREVPAQGADPRVLGTRLPLLTDLLAAIPDSVPLTIEVKGHEGERAAWALARALLPRCPPGVPPATGQPRVVVSSLRGRTVTHLAKALDGVGLDPDVVVVAPSIGPALWFLLGSLLPWNPPISSRYRRLQVPDLRLAGISLVSGRLLQKAHRRGMGVDVWTVDDPADMARLIRLMQREAARPVESDEPPRPRDGIMTDHPSLLAELVGVEDGPDDGGGADGGGDDRGGGGGVSARRRSGRTARWPRRSR